MFQTPPYLKKGDKVALLSPASYLPDRTPVVQASKLLESWGLIPVPGKHIMHRHYLYAGTDKQRLNDLQEALDNPDIKAIWMLRGGYGMIRIISEINLTVFRANPKWIIGFSDITALHIRIHNLGIKTIHACMPIQLSGDGVSEQAITTLHNALFGKRYLIKKEGDIAGRLGSMEGILIGGNLSMITAMLAADVIPDFTNKILFLEETGEPLYKIDRMLHSLNLAGVFGAISGLITGAFSGIVPNPKIKSEPQIHELFEPFVDKHKLPVLYDMPVGHIPDNRAFIIGDTIELNIGEFVSCIRFNRK